jgi:2TM domain
MDEELPSPTTSDREIAIRRRVHRLAEFYRHVFVFIVFMAALWALNAWQIYVSVKSIKWYSWWAMWPTMGWGIGLLSHGLAVLPVWNFFSEEWEDRKVKELMERERS